MSRRKTPEQREREAALDAVTRLSSPDPRSAQGLAIERRLRALQPRERAELHGCVVERAPSTTGTLCFVRIVEPWCGRSLSSKWGPVTPVIRRIMLAAVLEAWGAEGPPA